MKKKGLKLTALILIGVMAFTGCTAQEVNTEEQTSEATGEQAPLVQEEVQNQSYALSDTDPELKAIMDQFTDEQVWEESEHLDDTQKQLIAVASLVVQQSEGILAEQVQAALDAGTEPVQIREAIYQCAPYAGFPRTVDALATANRIFEENDITLPLEETGTVDESTRFDKGLDAQAGIFGDGMRAAAEGGKEAMTRSAYYLVTNCFGDYYTRDGLDLETREMLTLAILVNLGTESQLTSHIAGNANLGRDRQFIEDVIYQCLPYAGYPRILNALNCLNAALPEEVQAEAETSAEAEAPAENEAADETQTEAAD